MGGARRGIAQPLRAAVLRSLDGCVAQPPNAKSDVTTRVARLNPIEIIDPSRNASWAINRMTMSVEKMIMAALLNLVFLFPALGFLFEFARVRTETPVDEQSGNIAYEDRMLLGAIFGACLPALLNGSLVVLLGVTVIIATQAYVVVATDRSGLALLPTPHFHHGTISNHQTKVAGLALGGAVGGFVVSLIFSGVISIFFG